MTALWLQLALLVGAPTGDAPTFCELPADCGKGGVCVGFTCRDGSDRSAIEGLYTIGVAPPVVSGPPGPAYAAGKRLYAQLLADLRWSGFYTVKGKDELSHGWRFEGASPSEVRRSTWLADGLYRVVKVALGPAPGGKLKVRIRAVEIERFGTLDFDEGQAVVDEAGLRALSAAWVNRLIAHDTGVPGAVGTAIVGHTQVKPGVKEIARVAADGADFKQLSSNGNLNLGPAWGPGGIVGWMSYASGNADWVVDGKPLSTRPGLNAAGAWSPDGKVLALSVAEAGDSEIVLIDGEDGSEHARLTDHRAVDTSPAWAPDGKRMAFVSDRTGKPQIWILSLLRGGGLEPLTRDGYNTSPDWSPTGESLVYIRQVGGGNFVIMRHDFDTGQTRRLTEPTFSAESPTFSGDGRHIAFNAKGEEGSRLWIMNADGTQPRQLGAWSFFAPDWRKR